MKRLYTGLIIALLLVGTLLLRNVSLIFFDVFLGTAILLANLEISSALTKRNGNNIKYISFLHAVAMYVMLLVGIKFEFSTLNLILCQVYLLCGVFAITFIAQTTISLIKNRKLTKKDKVAFKYVLIFALKISFNTLLTCIYPNLLLGLLFIVNHISEFAFNKEYLTSDYGFLVLSLVFGIGFVTDIFAFVVGSVFGGPKLCPLISPKKTISGAIGGLVFAVIASIIGFYCFTAFSAYNAIFVNKNITILTFIILAIIGSVATQCGDIFASLIKRRSNIKDFGSILPGHGGVLDRFDGVIFNTVVIFVFSCIFLF